MQAKTNHRCIDNSKPNAKNSRTKSEKKLTKLVLTTPATNTANTTQKISICYYRSKKEKKTKKKHRGKENIRALYLRCINNTCSRGENYKKGSRPAEPTTQTHSKTEHEKSQHEKHIALVKKKKKTRGKNTARIYSIFLRERGGTNTCLLPQNTRTSNYTSFAGHLSHPRQPKKKENAHPGYVFKQKIIQ